MKKVTQISRKITVALTGFVIITASFTGCKKDDAPATTTVTEADAADAIALSVQQSSGGISEQASQTAQISARSSSSNGNCGLSKDSTITRDGTVNAATYSATLQWNWVLSCLAGIPNQIDLAVKGKTTYDGPRMSSADSSNGTYVITDLGLGKTEYNAVFSVVRNGSQVSKIRNKNTFTSVTTITGNGVKITKSTNEIASGTAQVNITGKASNGAAFTHSAAVVFLGNKTATITFTNGNVYNISW